MEEAAAQTSGPTQIVNTYKRRSKTRMIQVLVFRKESVSFAAASCSPASRREQMVTDFIIGGLVTTRDVLIKND